MERKYSVFLGNVGACSDRYCAEYAEPFNLEQLLERVASIELIKGVDIVLTPDVLQNIEKIARGLERTGLKVISTAVDHFTQAKWKQGSFSSIDPDIRRKAISATTDAMDIAAGLGCNLVTIWPGQDGYDSLFQADYILERTRFAEGVKEACRYRKDVEVTLEYKQKEPRTHSYVNSVGTTLLMVQEIAEENCGIVLDYGHALLGYENPAESVALLKKYGNKLKHVHINDNFRHWDDDMIVGSIHSLEYLEFFYWLKRTGYDRWITIDQFPYREDGRDAVAESAAWMDSFETLLERADLVDVAAVLCKKDAIASSRMMRKLLLG